MGPTVWAGVPALTQTSLDRLLNLCLFPSLQSGDHNMAYLRGLLGAITGSSPAGGSVQCLACCKQLLYATCMCDAWWCWCMRNKAYQKSNKKFLELQEKSGSCLWPCSVNIVLDSSSALNRDIQLFLSFWLYSQNHSPLAESLHYHRCEMGQP